MALPRCLTKDGFEMQLGVNHLGPFLLTNLLLDMLKSSAPSRIVVVASIAQSWGHIKKDDLNSEKSYSVHRAYHQSKLANVLFARALSKRLEGTGVTVNSLHPGFVKTDIARHYIRPIVQTLCDPISSFAFKTAKSGAQTTIAVAVDPELENVTGKYFSDCKIKREGREARDDDLAEWLWNISDEWTKLSVTTSPV